jgi:hypothetical protein
MIGKWWEQIERVKAEKMNDDDRVIKLEELNMLKEQNLASMVSAS